MFVRLFIALAILAISCQAPQQQYVDMVKKMTVANQSLLDAWVADRANGASVAKNVKLAIEKAEIDKAQKDKILSDTDKDLSSLKEADPKVVSTIKKAIDEVIEANKKIEEN